MVEHGISLDVFKNYPLAISIQDHSGNILYKNDRMVSLIGNMICNTCCDLLNNLSQTNICAKDKICLFEHDNEETKVIRLNNKEFAISCTKVDYKSEADDQFLLSIHELDQDSHHNQKSEIYHDHLAEKIQLGVAIYSEQGGELLVTEPLDWSKELSLKNLYINLSAFWFPAIGQGDNWQNGLYGPLPLLSYQNKLTFAYAFNLISNSRKDLRLHHFGYTLLYLMIDREIVDFFTPYSAIEKIIDFCLSPFRYQEDLDLFNLIQLKSHILELIVALNP